MNSRLRALAARRKALIAGSDRDRAEFVAIFGGIENKLGDAVVAGARRLHRHRFLVGAAGVVMLLAPFVFRSWIRRVMWLAPLALEGYRAVKTRPASPRADED